MRIKTITSPNKPVTFRMGARSWEVGLSASGQLVIVGNGDIIIQPRPGLPDPPPRPPGRVRPPTSDMDSGA